MNTDEIVKALRCEHGHLANHGRDFMLNYTREEFFKILNESAELIESLQAQLAESQRRERAAKESLKRKCLDERAAVKCICDVETYLELGSAKYIKKAIDAWRGPREDGEGGAE